MYLTFEPDQLDLARHLTLPAKVRLNGTLYDLDRWSFVDFHVNTPEHIQTGLDTPVEFILPFSTHQVSFEVHCNVLRLDRGRYRFVFTNLSQANRKLMRDYVESCLQGVEPEPDAQYDLVPAPTPPQQQQAARQLTRRLSFYGCLTVGLGALAWFVGREYAQLYSLRGAVTGTLVQYRAPEVGVLYKVHVKSGETVRQGQLLFEMDPSAHAAKKDQLLAVRRAAEAGLQQALLSAAEEEKRGRLFVEGSERKVKILQEQLAGLHSQVELARAVYERTVRLHARGAISLEDLQDRQQRYQQAQHAHEQKRQEIELQQLVTEEARQGRYFSGLDIKGNLMSRQELVALKREEVERINAQLVDVENTLRKGQVRATVDGTVYHCHRLEGDSLAAGECVATVEAEREMPYVVARFTAQDAQYLQHGGECRLVFLARGDVREGRIVGIGHAAVNGAGPYAVALFPYF